MIRIASFSYSLHSCRCPEHAGALTLSRHSHVDSTVKWLLRHFDHRSSSGNILPCRDIDATEEDQRSNHFAFYLLINYFVKLDQQDKDYSLQDMDLKQLVDQEVVL